MNHVIIVAGGVGSRMNLDIPKQYYEVKGVPVILYSFRKFAASPLIDSIVIVCADEWVGYLKEKLASEHYLQQVTFATSGKSRQHSVLNGLIALKEYAMDTDLVFVHDSVRPLFLDSNIQEGIDACHEYDGAHPVVSVKDATYQSYDGITISRLLPREELFFGQTPECFVFERLYKAHLNIPDEQLSNIHSCSELAFLTGLSVKLVSGTERNYKITTIEDLRAFELTLDVH